VDPVIQIRGLTKRFGGKTAVSGLSLDVSRGAICALLGDNGAGKTTTIRMLTGLLPPDHGQATILGLDCWKDAAELRHKVGYVPERPRFYDWMTVGEIGWFTAGFHTPAFLQNYQELTRRFQLEPRARLRTLSKGQYAKVGLALALAVDPEVLVLDEPTSGLDLLVRREFLTSMVDMAGAGRTIIISSHQIAEVERIASHVVFVSRGRLLLAATVDELRQRLVRVRLRYDKQPPDPQVLGTVLERSGSGKQWQAVLLDPNRAALDALYDADGIREIEESPLDLEEAYCALLAGNQSFPAPVQPPEGSRQPSGTRVEGQS
jgi:ABC-2 type transport system ATP-binding protein